jgi:hypothetical protein
MLMLLGCNLFENHEFILDADSEAHVLLLVVKFWFYLFIVCPWTFTFEL